MLVMKVLSNMISMFNYLSICMFLFHLHSGMHTPDSVLIKVEFNVYCYNISAMYLLGQLKPFYQHLMFTSAGTVQANGMGVFPLKSLCQIIVFFIKVLVMEHIAAKHNTLL